MDITVVLFMLNAYTRYQLPLLSGVVGDMATNTGTLFLVHDERVYSLNVCCFYFFKLIIPALVVSHVAHTNTDCLIKCRCLQLPLE